MTAPPVFVEGAWFVQQPDGSWLRWDEGAATWEPHSGPRPGAQHPAPLSPHGAFAPMVYPPYAAMAVRTNGFAVASLVLGILWLWWVGAALALIFGLVALNQIKRSNGTQTGNGLAIAGIALGAVWLGFGVIGLGAALIGG